MSNAALFVSWGRPLQGRESKALEVFSQVMEHYAGLEQQKKVAAHRTYLTTTGSMERLGGFMVIEGSVEQLRSVVDSDEWTTLWLRAEHCVGAVEIVHCVMGSEIQKYIGKTLEVRRGLGITT
jgi:hypothetical protein